ncbi:MAG: hypothetical protein ACOVN1_01520 [Limnohabitans sp.]
MLNDPKVRAAYLGE